MPATDGSQQSVVVVPTYNERENLPVLCEKILQSTQGETHVLIVDDNSPDGTGALADELSLQYRQIHVLHRERKQGLGRAYVAGFQRALEMGYSLIAQMDADLSHDPADLPRLLNALTDADLVIGSRYVPGGDVSDWARWRYALSRYANLYVDMVVGIPVLDSTSGYRMWRREVLEAIRLDTVQSNGYAFQIEMAYRAHRQGFRVREIPIVFTERRAGKSKLSRAVIWEAIWLPWKLRFKKNPPADYSVHPLHPL